MGVDPPRAPDPDGDGVRLRARPGLAAIGVAGAGESARALVESGSIGEGPNHSNYSDQSSVRILGIRRKP